MRQFTVSVRDKLEGEPVMAFLRKHFGSVPLEQLESVWGFLEPCTLYGGREFDRPQLSDFDIRVLNGAGIGLRIPLTNHFFTQHDYEKSLWLLDKYHLPLNSLIITNDELALRVKQDFPKYHIEASVIKNLRTLQRLERALELYDTVVTPMELNDDHAFLESLPNDQVRLFANAACAYTCPNKVCYVSLSKRNRGEDVPFECSQLDGRHPGYTGMKDFNIEEFELMGFSKFKLLRSK